MNRNLTRGLPSLVLVSALSAGGCASPLEKPIIEDHTHGGGGLFSGLHERSKVTVFSTTAARREVLIGFPKGDPNARICAEAPPDTADAITSSLAIAAQLKAKKGAAAEGEAMLDLSRSISNSINALFTRSQGIQLFRDGAFHLCLAWQNGLIDQKTYNGKYDELLNKTYALIFAEIPEVDANKAITAANNANNALSATQQAAARAEAAQREAEKAAQSAAASAKEAKPK